MGFMPGPRRSVWGVPHQKTLILAAWLEVWIQLTAGQGPGANVVTAAVGQTATLTAPPTVSVYAINWFRGTTSSDPMNIISYVPSTGEETYGPQYTRRESVLMDGSLRITGLQISDTGNYTATVTRTGGTLVTGTPWQLRVYEYLPTEAPKTDELSGGAIAGIVIAALVVVAGVAALVYFFVFKKPASGTTAGGTPTEMTPKINDGSASPKANGAPEIQYSSVNFVPKRGTPAKPIAPENTVYSEVRR